MCSRFIIFRKCSYRNVVLSNSAHCPLSCFGHSAVATTSLAALLLSNDSALLSMRCMPVCFKYGKSEHDCNKMFNQLIGKLGFSVI